MSRGFWNFFKFFLPRLPGGFYTARRGKDYATLYETLRPSTILLMIPNSTPTLATAAAFCVVMIPRTCSVIHLALTGEPLRWIASRMSCASFSFSTLALLGASDFLRGFVMDWSIFSSTSTSGASDGNSAIAFCRASARVIEFFFVMANLLSAFRLSWKSPFSFFFT